MLNAWQSVGFESIHEYDEGHSHFSAPWAYLVCFKHSTSRARWYQSAAELNIELHQRLHRTKSGNPALLYFDAPTMMGYQMPTKAQETVYCRSEPKPQECGEYLGFDPKLVNIPVSHLEVKKSTLGNGAGRGLFASRDIPEGSTLMIDVEVKAFHILPSTWSIIENLYEWADEDESYFPFLEDEISGVVWFVEAYGYRAMLLGMKHFAVDAGLATFCNHGCNGTYTLTDDDVGFTEMNVDLDHAPEALLNKMQPVRSPVFERHLRQITSSGDRTLRDIKKGEEIFTNYLGFVADPDDWAEEVLSLRSQCSGNSLGDISQYEKS
jgi:hypothetical protein